MPNPPNGEVRCRYGRAVRADDLVIRLREGAQDKCYWDAQWRYRTGPLEPWRLKKRRLGLAWQERDEGGAWRKRRGRCPEGWLDERAAHLAAVAAMDAQADALIAEARAAAKAAAALTVGVLAHDWLSWLEDVRGAKPSTIKDYSFLLREPGEAFKRGPSKTAGRIMKAFGDRPAVEVTTREVSDFLRSLDREGLTPRNVNKHREVLAAMFTYGCRADAFGVAANPVLATDKRRQAPPAALDYYEVEEVEALARANRESNASPERSSARPSVRRGTRRTSRMRRRSDYCSTPVCGSGRCSHCDGATSTSTAGCCSFAAAFRLAWKDYRGAAAPA